MCVCVYIYIYHGPHNFLPTHRRTPTLHAEAGSFQCPGPADCTISSLEFSLFQKLVILFTLESRTQNLSLMGPITATFCRVLRVVPVPQTMKHPSIMIHNVADYVPNRLCGDGLFQFNGNVIDVFLGLPR